MSRAASTVLTWADTPPDFSAHPAPKSRMSWRYSARSVDVSGAGSAAT